MEHGHSFWMSNLAPLVGQEPPTGVGQNETQFETIVSFL